MRRNQDGKSIQLAAAISMSLIETPTCLGGSFRLAETIEVGFVAPRDPALDRRQQGDSKGVAEAIIV